MVPFDTGAGAAYRGDTLSDVCGGGRYALSPPFCPGPTIPLRSGGNEGEGAGGDAAGILLSRIEALDPARSGGGRIIVGDVLLEETGDTGLPRSRSRWRLLLLGYSGT